MKGSGPRLVLTFCATLVWLWSASAALAATWTGRAGTTSWFDANWDSAGYPTSGTINIGAITPAAALANGVVVIDRAATAGSLVLGVASGTSGDLTIKPGATLTLSSSIIVGRQGTGVLTIDGGVVSATVITVGGVDGSPAGAGELILTGGGVLNTTSSGNNFVGYTNSSGSPLTPPFGSALIDGAGSAWNTNGLLIIGEGNFGEGTMTVSNGGRLSLTNASVMGLGISDSPTASGSLTITGAGSLVSSLPGIWVGIEGTGSLLIQDGGKLVSGVPGDYDYVAFNGWNGQQARGSVVVDGTGSSWVSNSAGIIVGAYGVGDMTIQNGASVTSLESGIGLGRGNASTPPAHGEVLITGPGSIWTAGTLEIAIEDGASGSLTVTNGGTMKTTDPFGIEVGEGGEGVINIGAAKGSAPDVPGVIDSAHIALDDQGALVFNHTSTGYGFAPVISGSGAIEQLAGTTILTGVSDGFSGTTDVSGGALVVNGTLGNAASTLSVGSGATLGGSGVIGGNVTIGSANLNPGNVSFGGDVGTLTISGSLTLSAASVLNYHVVPAGIAGSLNDLTMVGGDLVLNGTLNVDGVLLRQVRDPGVYHIISYDGALSGGGLALNDVTCGTPPCQYSVVTSIPHQVDLVNTGTPATYSFWDGDLGPKNNKVVDGGDGVWRAAAGDNWTSSTGETNGAYNNGSFAIFAGRAGTVTVDNSSGAVVSGGMQFMTSGYVIEGGPITLAAGAAVIRVGDGTRLGAGLTATIAADLTGPGSLEKSDIGTLILAGSNLYQGGTTITMGTLQLGDGGTSGSILGDVTNNGRLAFNRSDSSTFNGVISGSGGVDQIGSGTTILGAVNTYSGTTNVISGTLQAGVSGAFSVNSPITVGPSGAIDLDRHNQTVPSVTNAGQINIGNSTQPGVVLTVNGNYVGQGGTIRFDTYLGGSYSPSDHMVINGNTSGTTIVKVTNMGGLGAQTTGDGIELIEVNGQAGGTFRLGGRVAAGAYEYDLFSGGSEHSADEYLRSRYRSEVAVVTAVPALTSRLALALMGSSADRGSEDSVCLDDKRGLRAPLTGCSRTAWGRIFGETGSFGSSPGNGAPGTGGPAYYNMNLSGLQAGSDLYQDGRDRIGFYGSAGHVDTTIRGLVGGDAGTVGADAYAGGFYWNHRSPAGWYSDVVAQGTRLERLRATTFGGSLIESRGSSVILSAEAGYALALSSRLTLLPQAQVIFQHQRLDSVADAFSIMRFGATDEVYGRLGARLTQAWKSDHSQSLSSWAELNVWHQFSGDAQTVFSTLQNTGPAAFNASLGGSWAEAGIGLSGQITSRVSVFAKAEYDVALDRAGWSLGGRSGIRLAW